MVSIRSRPTGQEKQKKRTKDKPGRNCFNPLPAHRPRETGRAAFYSPGRVTVSIRSRPTGQEKQDRAGPRSARRIGFNPLPAHRPRETTPTPREAAEPTFQSAPGPQAKRN